MKVSIVIAVKAMNPLLRECLEHCRQLDYPDTEIIVLPDEPFEAPVSGARVIATGACLPAKKRDLGASKAQGEILAFLDDDAYPFPDWLTSAVENFSDPEVGAVGGPGITPADEETSRRLSGFIYESRLVSGNFRYRYMPGKKQLVDDFPSCNLLVRRDLFMEIGGFKTEFWPGEDTIFCLELTKKFNKKIVYEPAAVVCHHRRKMWLPHLKQISKYAFHRGFFVKHYPQTSLRWQYFVPSAFLIFVFLGFFVDLFLPPVRILYRFILAFYAVCVLIFSFKDSLRFGLRISAGIFVSHLAYGFYFLKGLFKKTI